MSTDRPRDRSDMEYEIRYSLRLLTLHANLARNTDHLMNAATLLGLTSAVGSLINQSPQLASAAGGLLAVVAVAQVLFKPAEKRILARLSRQRYAELWSQARQLTDAQLEERLAQLHGDDLDEIEGLRLIADIDTRQELGLDAGDLAMNWWNRLLKFCS